MSNRLLVFPSVKFRCTGTIVRWVFSGTFNALPNSAPEFPELQVWASDQERYYLRAASNYNNIELPVEKDLSNRITFRPTNDLVVEEGEFLGLLIRNKDYSERSIQFHFKEDPAFATEYYYTDITPSNTTCISEGIVIKQEALSAEQRYIPMITVELQANGMIHTYIAHTVQLGLLFVFH